MCVWNNGIIDRLYKCDLSRHTAVVVFGREYFYGGAGIMYCHPVSTLAHNPVV